MPLDQATRQAAEQAAISAAITAAVAQVWPALDLNRLDETFPGFLQQVIALVASFKLLSAQSAARYYRDNRAAAAATLARERVAGRLVDVLEPDIRPYGQVDLARLTTSLLVTGPVRIKQATAKGVSLADSGSAALVQASGAAQQEVAHGGRDTIANAGKSDGLLVGFQRVLHSSQPCYFCAMLASRGPVYRLRSSAGGQDPRGNITRWHDHCNCQVVPVYETDTELMQDADSLSREWDESTRGKHGHAAVIAFRQHWEGR